MNVAKRMPHHHAPATRIRSQAACVRTLLDEVERGLPPDLDDPMSIQLVEELARLGSRCSELAAQLMASR